MGTTTTDNSSAAAESIMQATAAVLPKDVAAINAIIIVHDAESTYAAASAVLQTAADDKRTAFTTAAATATSKSTSSSTNSDDNASSSNEDNTSTNNTDDWNEMYTKLKNAYKYHGWEKEVKNLEELGRLALWISRQRMYRDKLTKQQREKLEQLAEPGAAQRLNLTPNSNFVANFDWGKQRRGANHLRWEQMWTKLVAYSQEFGHVKVPIRWKRDATLGKWVSRQRDTAAQLSHERAFKLNQLGFVWQCGNNTIHSRKEAEEKARMMAAAKARMGKGKVDQDAIFELLMEQERKRLQIEQTKITKHRAKRIRMQQQHLRDNRRGIKSTPPPALSPKYKTSYLTPPSQQYLRATTPKSQTSSKPTSVPPPDEEQQALMASSLARAVKYNERLALELAMGGPGHGDDDGSVSSNDTDDSYHYRDNFFHVRYQRPKKEDHHQPQPPPDCPSTPTRGTTNHTSSTVTATAAVAAMGGGNPTVTPVINNRQPIITSTTDEDYERSPIKRYGDATADDPFSPSPKRTKMEHAPPLFLDHTTTTTTTSPSTSKLSLEGDVYEDALEQFSDHVTKESATVTPHAAAPPKPHHSSSPEPTTNTTTSRLAIQMVPGSPIFTPTKTTVTTHRKRQRPTHTNNPLASAAEQEESRSFALACCRRFNPSEKDWKRKQQWTFVCK